MYVHYLSMGESFFCGWEGNEPIFSKADDDCVYMPIEEAGDEYQKLDEIGYDAEIETCWVPSSKAKS